MMWYDYGMIAINMLFVQWFLAGYNHLKTHTREKKPQTTGIYAVDNSVD